MRSDSSLRGTRGSALAVPAALAGSIALALGSSPAHAATAAETAERMPRPALPALRAVPAEAPDETYVVQPGDSVSSIAAAHGLRTADVLALNGLSWENSVIHAGLVLRLGGAPAPQAVAPTPESAAPTPAPAPIAASAYTVASGDTITSIAAAHGLSIRALFDANGLDWSSIIYPGETLAIPGGDLQLAASTTPVVPVVPGLDAEQAAYAQLIVRIGRELGVPDRGIAIALGTAMQESWIRNLDWGDRDSLGLFQQRPSTGWGTAAEVLDPDRAIRAFYGGASDPNGSITRGLLDIPGWQAMTFADAAQAVQISAYPERYAQWEQPAYAWLATLG